MAAINQPGGGVTEHGQMSDGMAMVEMGKIAFIYMDEAGNLAFPASKMQLQHHPVPKKARIESVARSISVRRHINWNS
jgi:hypothetical protein